MGKIKVVAGDIDQGSWNYSRLLGAITTCYTKEHPWAGETYSFGDMEKVEEMDKEKVKKLSGSLGWGIVGAALFGPLGALGGLLLGGHKEEVVFCASLKNGKQFLAVTDGKTWKKIMAARFQVTAHPIAKTTS